MPENETHRYAEISGKLEGHYDAAPNPVFAARLEAQLARQAGFMRAGHTPAGAGRLAQAARWGLGLTALAGLVLLIALSVSVLPNGGAPTNTAAASLQPSETPVPAAVLPSATTEQTGPSTPVPSLVLPPTADLTTAVPAAAVPAPLPLAPGICPDASPTPSDIPAFMQKPSRLLGGGELSQDGFTFEIYLACIPAFTPQVADWSLYSEYEGLGVYYTWKYRGPTQTGEALVYSGFEPFVRMTGSSGPALQDGTYSQEKTGIQFPVGVFPNLAGQTVPLRYVLKLQSPDGRWHGVGLNFIMQPEANGAVPQNISAHLLNGPALSEPDPVAEAAAPFPTLEPAAAHPLLGEITALNARWENTMLSGAGWMHLVTHQESQTPGGALTNGGSLPAISTDDSWYLLDEQGRTLAWITRQLDETGQPTQISIMKDGISTNLTLGETNRVGSPHRTGLDFGFYNMAAWEVKLGRTLRKEALPAGETGGFPAIRFILEHQQDRTEVVYNAETGQAVTSRLYRPDQNSQEMKLQDQLVVVTAERVEAPPEDILNLLDRQVAPYQPLPPMGEPTPQGFDPSHSPISLKMVAGDSATTPTFWFGDLYALYPPGAAGGNIIAGPGEVAGYLLGRVDFGFVAGGWCDRSSDGKRLAFNYTNTNNLIESSTRLHWLDLRDVTAVHDPVPELNLISPPSWAPQGHRLAFSACNANQNCGVYLLEGDDGPARLLSSRVSSSIPPLWKPDGSQVAVMMPLDSGDPAVIAVIDVDQATVLMQTALDISPVKDWGVAFLESLTSFERCTMPK